MVIKKNYCRDNYSPSVWKVRNKIIDEVVLEKGFRFLLQSVGGEVEIKLR